MSEPPIVTRTRLNRCELVMEMFRWSYAIVGGSKEEQQESVFFYIWHGFSPRKIFKSWTISPSEWLFCSLDDYFADWMIVPRPVCHPQMHNKTHPETYVIDRQTQGQTDRTEHRQYKPIAANLDSLQYHPYMFRTSHRYTPWSSTETFFTDNTDGMSDSYRSVSFKFTSCPLSFHTIFGVGWPV